MSATSWSGATWVLAPAPEDQVEELERALGLGAIASRCLWLRGGTAPESARRILAPSLDSFHDPSAIHQMDRALERLRRALREQDHVRVVTDYDVDGTTSSLILQSTLRVLGLQTLSYHIPDRMDEGYGFSVRAAEKAAEDGVALIVTADIGVKDHASVSRARALGVDVIICDHHLPPDTDVPADATAVLCPPQAGCDYPNPALAACGVSLKLAQALLAEHPKRDAILFSQLKLAAIGTVADVVDLSTPENRAIVSLGLESLNRGRHSPGLAALLQCAGLEPGGIQSSDLGFRLGPRINAAGRMASATDVVELLTTRDGQRATDLAQRIEGLNKDRRQVQERMLQLALDELGDEPPPFIVVGGPEADGWHRGVVGIVAARLRDKYHRPAAVLSIHGDSARGSVRSTSQVHAVQALEGAADLLERFGGHPAAAGFSCRADVMPALAAHLSDQAQALTGGQVPPPTRTVDATLPASALDRRLHDALAQLAPHGKGNPAPRLAIRGRLGDTRLIKESHLKARLEGPRSPVDLIWWGAAAEHGKHWQRGAEIEVLGTLGLNVWRGRETLQVTVDDVRHA